MTCERERSSIHVRYKISQSLLLRWNLSARACEDEITASYLNDGQLFSMIGSPFLPWRVGNAWFCAVAILIDDGVD
jgi:hypothetical protein